MEKVDYKENEWKLEGKKIFARSWLPAKKPKSIINLVHGQGEHSGRYERWGKLFASEGYGLIAIDLFGHGKTEGRRAHVKNYQLLLDQVDLMIQKSRELFPGVPMILYGHSMGGNIAINYAISKDPPVSALIASSPWLRLVIPVSAAEKTGSRIANSLVPGLVIKAKGVTHERLSHDPEHWESVSNDPLVHNKISIRYVHDIIKRGEYAIQHGNQIKKPFLLMHGDADEITSHKASGELAATNPDRVHLKIWDGLRHELHNEFEYKEVLSYIIDWLEEVEL